LHEFALGQIRDRPLHDCDHRNIILFTSHHVC
jgi:hypothetical protein